MSEIKVFPRRIFARVRRAWAVKSRSFDGLAVIIAKTEAGARGFARKAIAEAGYCHGGHLDAEDFEVFAIPAMARRSRPQPVPCGEGAVV